MYIHTYIYIFMHACMNVCICTRAMLTPSQRDAAMGTISWGWGAVNPGTQDIYNIYSYI